MAHHHSWSHTLLLAMGISTHLSNYRDQLVQAFPLCQLKLNLMEVMLRLHELVVKGKSVDKHNDAKTQKWLIKMMSAPFGIPANFQKANGYIVGERNWPKSI